MQSVGTGASSPYPSARLGMTRALQSASKMKRLLWSKRGKVDEHGCACLQNHRKGVEKFSSLHRSTSAVKCRALAPLSSCVKLDRSWCSTSRLRAVRRAANEANTNLRFSAPRPRFRESSVLLPEFDAAPAPDGMVLAWSEGISCYCGIKRHLSRRRPASRIATALATDQTLPSVCSLRALGRWSVHRARVSHRSKRIYTGVVLQKKHHGGQTPPLEPL